MVREELFKHSVSVLLDAYKEGTLRSGHTCGCAVGNLVASGLGLEVLGNGNKWSNGDDCFTVRWTDVVSLGDLHLGNYKGKSKKEIDATGYSPQELIRIELGFEQPNGQNPSYWDDDILEERLQSTVSVLKDIHQVQEDEICPYLQELEGSIVREN